MLLIQVCQIAKKNKNWTMDQMEMMKIVIRMMKPKEQIIKIKMKESHTANTVKRVLNLQILFSGPNAGKYGPEKTAYLDSFHAVQGRNKAGKGDDRKNRSPGTLV